MSDDALEIAVMLIQHRAQPTGSPYCVCGWRPVLMLNDTEADRGQHIAHQAEMIDEMQRRKRDGA
jgi:hypothetical protein